MIDFFFFANEGRTDVILEAIQTKTGLVSVTRSPSVQTR